MAPAVTVARPCGSRTAPSRAGLAAIGDRRPFQSPASLDLVTGSLGSATEASGRVMVTAAFGQERQGQERFVMHGIEVHGFVKTILGTLTVAGRLANHSHQIIGCRRKALETEGVVRRRQRPRQTALGWPSLQLGPATAARRTGDEAFTAHVCVAIERIGRRNRRRYEGPAWRSASCDNRRSELRRPWQSSLASFRLGCTPINKASWDRQPR